MGQIYSIHTAQAVGAGVDYEVIKTLKRAVGVRRYEEIAEKAAMQLADRLGKLDRKWSCCQRSQNWQCRTNETCNVSKWFR